MVPDSASRARILAVNAFGGSVRLPGSKSLTNRALLVAGLARGTSRLINPLDCDDSRYLRKALRELGVDVRELDIAAERGRAAVPIWEVDGAGGVFPVRSGSFFLGNAGTSTRFLTAALTTSGGRYEIDGDERMRKRPIGELVTALNALGGDVDAPTGCPPVSIGPRRLLGGAVDIGGNVSSQFISAILMAGPLAERPIELRIRGELVSGPYIELTLSVIEAFGGKAWLDAGRPDGQPVYRVLAGRGYRAREYFVEGDASAASYFYAAAAITGDTIRVEGVGKESAQGDMRCADVLAEMGCRVKKEADAVTVTGAGVFLRGVDVNCSEMPDVVPTLAVAAVFARGRTRLRGVPHLRFKESDRIASVATELRKIGATVRELRDGLEIEGALGVDPNPLHGAEIDTWSDHRIAMAFSVAGLMIPDIVILDPAVITKSYPEFYDALGKLGGRVVFSDTNGREVGAIGASVGS